MFFDKWSDLLRVAVVGVPAYALLVLLLRVSGKRTLAKMNAFDLVVTVAFGSTLATILLSSDVSYVEGGLAFVVLVAAQFVVAWLSVRLPWFRKAVRSEPTLLLWDGRLRGEVMKSNRVSEAEVHQAVRSSGAGDLTKVAAVVLETDGTLSVIPRSEAGDLSALADVPGTPAPA